LNIHSAEFAGAIGNPRQSPPESVRGLPQLAFAGRSNVGKSSLINRFLGRTRSPIARVSGQPGKTREINFFHVRWTGPDFALVDLPGYGFARAPAAVREQWATLIDGFLRSATDLAGVVQLIDIRHSPTRDDRRSLGYLAELGIPVLIALTKSDKLGAMKRQDTVRKLVGELGVEPDQVIATSAESGEGRDALLESVAGLLGVEAEG
jgi:GTP-binding protein